MRLCECVHAAGCVIMLLGVCVGVGGGCMCVWWGCGGGGEGSEERKSSHLQISENVGDFSYMAILHDLTYWAVLRHTVQQNLKMANCAYSHTQTLSLTHTHSLSLSHIHTHTNKQTCIHTVRKRTIHIFNHHLLTLKRCHKKICDGYKTIPHC